MSCAVTYSDVADLELDDIVFWLLARDPERAEDWRLGLVKAVESLANFPRRFPIASEFEGDEREVRQMMCGPYRVLYTIRDADGDGEEDTITILHVRHGARERDMR